MLQMRWKFWIEKDGVSVFGEGRAHLLEAIAETGSLSAAARRLGIPYRTAWKHLNTMEAAYGTPLVERQAGGAAGGGCHLTEAGGGLLDGYRRFHDGLDELLAERARRCIDLR